VDRHFAHVNGERKRYLRTEQRLDGPQDLKRICDVIRILLCLFLLELECGAADVGNGGCQLRHCHD
jgi:hypothetical protein